MSSKNGGIFPTINHMNSHDRTSITLPFTLLLLPLSLMNNTIEKDATAMRPSAAPKRVAGGLVLKAKKKKRQTILHNRNSATASTSSSMPSALHQSGVPSILTSIPAHEEIASSSQQSKKSEYDEFEDTADFDIDVPSDALMCIQTYTRSLLVGGMSETCAYCPIFTHEGDDGSHDKNCSGGSSSSSTHAAPFLPMHVLLHLLNSNSSTSTITDGTSSRTHIEQDIKQLASSNKICLLQLHGTAITGNGGGSLGWKGDGNDDEDVAIMETSVYVTAAEMALQSYFKSQSSETLQHSYKKDMTRSWFTSMFLPYFAGRKWISSGALDSFLDDVVADAMESNRSSDSTSIRFPYSMSQMKEMLQQLVHAGILLPRRGVGPSGGGEGYWFSLPGLGKAAKSIVDGRSNLLRRLQSSRYKQKKRSVLEHEIGRIKLLQGGTMATKKKNLEQAGKFVLLDMLALYRVEMIDTACNGEQFIRLVVE